MKNFSPFQITMLAVFGALGLAGVLIFAFAVGGNTQNTLGPVQIWGTFDSKAFGALLDKAKENDPRLSSVSYVQKDSTTYESDLTDAIANGQGPDLFVLRQDYALRDAGKISPIPLDNMSPSQFQSTFIDAANPFFTSAGALGIPLFVDPLVLYWNRDLLSVAGYAKPPVYWEELPELAQKITQKNETGGILKSAIAFGEYANISNAKDILSTLILQAGGTITTQDKVGRFMPALSARAGDTSQPTESALRFYTQFADPANNVDYTWNRSLPEAQRAFGAGNLALYIGHASEKSAIVAINPNLNFALAPLPQIKIQTPEQRSLDTARVYALARTRTSKNPSGALTVASLLASAQNAEDGVTALGIPSALRDVLSKKVEGDQDIFNKQAIIARSWIDPDPERTADIFRAMIERVTSGALRLSESVQRANEEMTPLTDKYNN